MELSSGILFYESNLSRGGGWMFFVVVAALLAIRPLAGRKGNSGSILR